MRELERIMKGREDLVRMEKEKEEVELEEGDVDLLSNQR